MISSKKFITTKIEELVTVFTDTKLSLVFDKLTETFYVKVTPANKYISSEKFQDISADVLDEFLDLYPDDSIVFITDESLVKFEEYDFEKEGKMYKSKANGSIANFLNFELELKKAGLEFCGENTYALAA